MLGCVLAQPIYSTGIYRHHPELLPCCPTPRASGPQTCGTTVPGRGRGLPHLQTQALNWGVTACYAASTCEDIVQKTQKNPTHDSLWSQQHFWLHGM